ncbi:unnamed protein product [Gordionus sp. m RMFG-2023]
MHGANLAPVVDTYFAFRKAAMIIEAMKQPLSLRYYANTPVYTDASNSHIGICFWDSEYTPASFNEDSLVFNIPGHAISHINATEELAVGIGALLAFSKLYVQ